MIGYITIGTNDSEVSGRFYDAVFGALGGERKFSDSGWLGYGKKGSDHHEVYICPPFDKKGATFGNGMMIAFKAEAKSKVDIAHAAGCANGGHCEGPPGFRPPDKDTWYGAYLRDPVGNKIAIYWAA